MYLAAVGHIHKTGAKSRRLVDVVDVAMRGVTVREEVESCDGARGVGELHARLSHALLPPLSLALPSTRTIEKV